MHGALTAALVLALPACRGPQSILDPVGPSAREIATVGWWMFGVAAVVLLGVVALWLWAMRGRGERPAPPADGVWPTGGGDAAADAREARRGRRWLIGGGVVLPGVAISTLLVLGTPSGRHHLLLPGAGHADPAPVLRIDAIGQQWWWTIHYPDSGVRLRNELRIPVGRPVEIITSSADVIHSFWVPRLGGKLDALPGRRLAMRLQADEAGTFRSQCAEFCGLGHAHMMMVVHAMPADQFDAWLAGQ